MSTEDRCVYLLPRDLSREHSLIESPPRCGAPRSLFHANDSTDPAVFQHNHDLIVEKDERRSQAAQSSKRYLPSR